MTETIDLMERLAASLKERVVVPCPPPGIYRNIPAVEYHSWEAASNSRLTKLHRSPAHLRASLDEPKADTVALRLGRAMHSAILEPNDFAQRYVAGPIGDRRTKAVKTAWEELEARYGEGCVLSASHYATCLRTRASVAAHAGAAKLFVGEGDIELSLVWDDPDTGVRCKARLDRYTRISGGVIADVKSTTDARKEPFQRSIETYGYHRQAAFYLDGAAQCSIVATHFVNVAIEKEAPFAVGAYRMRDDDEANVVDIGRRQLRTLLRTYASCLASDHWPAYSPLIEDVSLPAWAWSRVDEDLAELEAAS